MRRNFLLVVLLFSLSTTGAWTAEPASPSTKVFRAGAYAVDVTPQKFPVIVNGMFEERTGTGAADPLYARAIVLDDGTTRIAFVVVDNTVIPRELFDASKELAAKATGIPTGHMLMSATHTHSTPSVYGVLGSRPDPDYPAFLIPQIARAIQLANDRLQPARIGWSAVHDPQHTHCRQWIFRPDHISQDPFGKPTVRSNMHPGYQNPATVGPSGPVDDQLSLLAVQALDGKPLAVLANYSMHYVGSPLVSSDYYGRFSLHLAQRIAVDPKDSPCMVAMSQGSSGDQMWMDYGAPQKSIDYETYAAQLSEVAERVYRQVQYHDWVPLGIMESKLLIKRQLPDPQRLAWAKETVASLEGRQPRSLPEVYANEQLLLVAEPEKEIKLQAIRVGDLGITGCPMETYGLTGIKLKRQSPLQPTFNIGLANGGEAYCPPPEQFPLGGYTTWAARTAGLDPQTEPRIVAELLTLLEKVSGKPRRELADSVGTYTQAVLASKPLAYWRMNNLSGSEDRDSSGNQHPARYEDGVVFYLDGPAGAGFTSAGAAEHAAHFAGGRARADLPHVAGTYSVELWFWNGLASDARPIAAYLFSRGPEGAAGAPGDHAGIGGSDNLPGRLFFCSGSPGPASPVLRGRTLIEPRTWNQLVLVRDGNQARIYLNGNALPEISGEVAAQPEAGSDQWFVGGRNDSFANLEGKLAEVSVYDRSLTPDEIVAHYRASEMPAKPIAAE